MRLNGAAKMIRIHFGEDDRWQGKPLHEAIVEAARRQDLAAPRCTAASKDMAQAAGSIDSTC